MGRIISVLLFAAAVIVAAIYLLKGKRVDGEDVRKAHGWKRHLLAAVALVLAILGARGLGNAETGDAGGTPTPGSEKPDEITAAWATLRAAWRKIDTYSAQDHETFAEEQKVKKDLHAKAVKDLVAAAVLPEAVGDVLDTSFSSATNSAMRRSVALTGPMVTCYKMTMLGAASARAVGQIAKAAMHLAELDASGKLSPAVIEKTRTQIARDMRIIVYARTTASYENPQPLIDAYDKGETIEIPDDVKQAADVLMQLLTSDEPPLVPGIEETTPAPGDQSQAPGTLRKLWLEIDEYPEGKDFDGTREIGQAKAAEHAKTIAALVAGGAMEENTAKVLNDAYNSLTRTAPRRTGMVSCYILSTVGAASMRAEREFLKASSSLAEMAASGKLLPAVVEKARKQIARDLMIIGAVKKHDDPAVQKMAEAYLAGKEFAETVPEEFTKAAEVLAEIMTATE